MVEKVYSDQEYVCVAETVCSTCVQSRAIPHCAVKAMLFMP